MSNSGRNGAQGRLYTPPGLDPFIAFDTDAPPSGLDAVANWFTAASAVGTGGSNLEMALAPAAWAFDPANAATNAGFLRDEGAVLVLFFVQDEPDQTPAEAGIPQEMIDRIAAAKSQCGGLDCVVAGGTVNEGCLGEVPLGQFFDALDPAVVNTATLPLVFYGATPDPDLFLGVLEQNLVEVIAKKCDEIAPPVG